jgi:hypothetical protein
MSLFLIVLTAVFLAGCALGAFVVLVLGIHTEQHRKTLHGHMAPPTVTSASTRRLLSTVSRPRPDDNLTKFAI